MSFFGEKAFLLFLKLKVEKLYTNQLSVFMQLNKSLMLFLSCPLDQDDISLLDYHFIHHEVSNYFPNCNNSFINFF